MRIFLPQKGINFIKIKYKVYDPILLLINAGEMNVRSLNVLLTYSLPCQKIVLFPGFQGFQGFRVSSWVSQWFPWFPDGFPGFPVGFQGVPGVRGSWGSRVSRQHIIYTMYNVQLYSTILYTVHLPGLQACIVRKSIHSQFAGMRSILVAIYTFFALQSAVATGDRVNVGENSHDVELGKKKPFYAKKAETARWLAHQNTLGGFGTISSTK